MAFGLLNRRKNSDVRLATASAVRTAEEGGIVHRRSFVRSALAALALMIVSAAGAPALAEEDKLTLVATTSMIADAARQVGGERVDVRALMGPGVDPHAYRQTRSDIAALTRADLVLWHGLYLEAQMEAFMETLGNDRTVIAVGEAVPEDQLLSHTDYSGRFDPHIWMDPLLWPYVVNRIADALVDLEPESEGIFRENARQHLAEIEGLSDYSKTALETVPADARVLLTAHDAFNYFGEAYDVEVVGIQGISTESEAGLNRISELVDLLVERDVKAVFVESSVSDRNIRALIEGAAAKGHTVVIGGELFSDAMGADGSYEGTYLGMIDHNATLIARALGGEAPERGMNGRLGAGS